MPTPYKVTCEACGAELTITDRTMDRDGDVIVEVEPCKDCLNTAREEE